jgi:hypothetical protein
MQHCVTIQALACKIPFEEALTYLVDYHHLSKSKANIMTDIFYQRDEKADIYRKMNWLGINCKNPPPCFPLVNPETGKIAAYLYAVRTIEDNFEIYTWYFCALKPEIIGSRFMENCEKCICAPQNEEISRLTFYSYS